MSLLCKYVLPFGRENSIPTTWHPVVLPPAAAFDVSRVLCTTVLPPRYLRLPPRPGVARCSYSDARRRAATSLPAPSLLPYPPSPRDPSDDRCVIVCDRSVSSRGWCGRRERDPRTRIVCRRGPPSPFLRDPPRSPQAPPFFSGYRSRHARARRARSNRCRTRTRAGSSYEDTHLPLAAKPRPARLPLPTSSRRARRRRASLFPHLSRPPLSSSGSPSTKKTPLSPLFLQARDGLWTPHPHAVGLRPAREIPRAPCRAAADAPQLAPPATPSCRTTNSPSTGHGSTAVARVRAIARQTTMEPASSTPIPASHLTPRPSLAANATTRFPSA